jgi:hypothetical protein
MTSDILKRAAEAALLPCPFCGRAAHLRDDASHSTAAFIGCETEGCFGYMLWAETATDAAREWNQRPDMAAAIAERDAEIERLTARAEAAEAMADRLAEAATELRDDMLERARCEMDVIHGEEYRVVNAGNGAWTGFCKALSAHAAMKEGTSTLSPIAAAARVLLADDVAISRMAEAIHDGPLGAEGHWFSAATKQGGWCVDVARAALRALAEQEKADD